MFKKLTEAINVNGAELIGTAKGYDLFDIRTYEAAQEFVVENTRNRAGQAYVQNQNTFNQNINENQRLYFFVESNTNHVHAGVVKSQTSRADIQIQGERQSITLSSNFLFETNNAANANRTLPLFLIPGMTIVNCDDNLIIRNNKLMAVLPQLTADETIILDLHEREDIREIDANAFYFGMHVTHLTLGENIRNISSGMFDTVDHISVT